MAICLALCCCCLKNVKPCKILSCIISFVVCFSILFYYLWKSEFTFWWTALWVSTLTAIIFTLLVFCNLYFRVAAVVFFIQLFSRFGLSVVFFTISWITIQTSMGFYLSNTQDYHQNMASITNGSSEFERHGEVMFVEGLMGFLHYCVLIPFLALYLYCIAYEVTYEIRLKRNQDDDNSEVVQACIQVGKYVLAAFAGVIVTATSAAFVFHRMNYRDLNASLKAFNIVTHNMQKMKLTWLILYYVSCLLLLGISFFSDSILELRDGIVEKYFTLQDGLIRKSEGHVFISKPKSERTTLKACMTKKTGKKPRNQAGKLNTTGSRATTVGDAATKDSYYKNVVLSIENERAKFTNERHNPDNATEHPNNGRDEESGNMTVNRNDAGHEDSGNAFEHGNDAGDEEIGNASEHGNDAGDEEIGNASEHGNDAGDEEIGNASEHENDAGYEGIDNASEHVNDAGYEGIDNASPFSERRDESNHHNSYL